MDIYAFSLCSFVQPCWKPILLVFLKREIAFVFVDLFYCFLVFFISLASALKFQYFRFLLLVSVSDLFIGPWVEHHWFIFYLLFYSVHAQLQILSQVLFQLHRSRMQLSMKGHAKYFVISVVLPLSTMSCLVMQSEVSKMLACFGVPNACFVVFGVNFYGCFLIWFYCHKRKWSLDVDFFGVEISSLS